MTTPHTMPDFTGAHDTGARTPVSARAKTRTARKGLYVRFVTRMSGDLSAAVSTAARRDGLTAGAWVRRLLLERLDLQSPRDARSGRPIRRPDEDQVAIAAAVREIAAVSLAVAANDEAAAKQGLDRVRSILIPLAVRRYPT